MSNDKSPQPSQSHQPSQPAQPAKQSTPPAAQPVTMPIAGDGTPFQKSGNGGQQR